MTRKKKKLYLLRNVDALLQKKPFFRGSDTSSVNDVSEGQTATVTETRTARLPKVSKKIITQEKFLKELDPMSHDVLFDNNLPSICVKLEDGGYQEIKFKRTSLALQEQILASHVIYLCGNPCVLSLRGGNPSEKDKDNYSTIKEYWVDRNMDGWRTKAVRSQLSSGDSGLLFYYDYKNRVKCRLLSYEDGYVIISHNDKNGDRLLESVYYADSNGVEYIDSYDDKYMYRMRNSGENAGEDGWVRETPVKHGFSEIPLCTKRGNVAWDKAQSLIEIYEIIYNIFFVIQKRNGWGILYIRGNLSETTKKLAGNIILQDKSMDGNGSAEFKAPPSPEGMLNSLEDLFEKIQINSSCTFLLPKDVKSSGDISGLAITLTRDLDLKNAQQGVIEWQNFADKMMRLFKEGLAKELVKNGENANAVTEFSKLRVSCKFKIWQPFSATEYNNMLISMKQAGILSTKTAIEKNTESVPDEEQRMAKEKEETKKEQEANIINRKVEEEVS
ncbi:phage portal protein [uncultured Bacteroides sp.]|uniref:phage portal protein n=1 Tax=uncultured Bacteroides sp. TaxID=162156 RepID=UPI0025998920|nr:phage portal protein [uncultured Bacteroides sp.]